MNLVFNCSADNDLYRALHNGGTSFPRYYALQDALEHAPDGAGLLVLADGYPCPGAAVDDGLLHTARNKDLRLYIEYPTAFPGLETGEPRPARWERLVVTSGFFEPELAANVILALHGCWFLPVQANAPHLALARVAGYNRAVYGLPEEAFPILFERPDHHALVATSKLSGFVTGRYGPTDAWKTLWERLLCWLGRTDKRPALAWTPVVGIQAGPDDRLPEGAEADAFRRSVAWFREQAVSSIGQKKGAVEGFESAIDHTGRQMRWTRIRGDCTAETGMVFAQDKAITGNPASRRLAGQMLNCVWSGPDFLQNDPGSPVYGLVNWYERGPVFYGDDNARVLLPSLAAARLLEDDRWDEHILRCLLANLRTTGIHGFRRNAIRPGDLVENRTWRFFYDEPFICCAPHYQAYLWASFLWAYALTGYEGFLTRPLNAVRMTMDAYPKWRWTNGLTQELARMLLPLAFLVRIQDTPERRAWLNRIAADLLAQMQPCGTIREQIGPIEDGGYPPPRSNETYGTTEASIIQENGDPVCDLLYTINFAFLGLHEAAAATGDDDLKRAEDRLADFFCRIQVRSSGHPYLDGAWMRAFDYERWEYWGSSSDRGWGAWCVESGWTNTWIASVLAMRSQNEALFDLTLADRFKTLLPALLEEMELS